MTFEYWFRIAVALETIVFPGDFSQIALNGIVSALGRHCQYCYQNVTKNRRGDLNKPMPRTELLWEFRTL